MKFLQPIKKGGKIPRTGSARRLVTPRQRKYAKKFSHKALRAYEREYIKKGNWDLPDPVPVIRGFLL